STTGATIHYTIDGTTPTASSKVYSKPVTVSYDQTLKALAVKDGRVNSSVTSSPFDVNIYGVKGAPAAVQFSVKSGTYLVGQTVTLSSATSGAVIHYTADWSEPTESSPIYKTPLNVSKTMTIKARAFITTLGSTYSSPVTGENYQIKGTVVQ
ncbi:MAG: endoglucanase EglA, partial [Fibrobacterota bacterium]